MTKTIAIIEMVSKFRKSLISDQVKILKRKWQEQVKMMHGMVTINDEPTKSRIYRFCEKKIDQWVQDHRDEVNGDDKESSPANAAFNSSKVDDDEILFTVSFTEQETHQVACTTEVQCRGRSFRGWDLAQDTQNAFMHSLRRLQKAMHVSSSGPA